MLILASIIYAVILFVVQTIIFRMTSRKILHIIPLALIVLVYLSALIIPPADHVMVELGRNDGYMFYSFTSLLIAGINTIGLISVGIAWLIENI